jgi:hypothetical protein
MITIYFVVALNVTTSHNFFINADKAYIPLFMGLIGVLKRYDV